MNPETNERIETVDVESNPSMDASAALSSAKSLNQIPFRQPGTESASVLSDEQLNRLLSNLAQDVPPVPDSFRHNWRQVVRHEKDTVKSSPKMTSMPVGATPLEKEPSVPSPGNVEQLHSPFTKKLLLQRSMGVAAIMLFLLGGTMLAFPSLFVFPKKTSPSPLAFSPMPLSAQNEIVACETVEEEETAFKATEEENTILESSSEADMAYEADIPVSAGSRRQSSLAGQNPAEELGNQSSSLSQSAVSDEVFSGSTSGLLPEEASAVTDNLSADSVAPKEQYIISQAAGAKSLTSTFFRPVQVLGALLLILALLLFFLRRRTR